MRSYGRLDWEAGKESERPEHPGRSALRRGRISLPNHAYFVTKCAAVVGTHVLARPECAEAIVTPLRWLRENEHVWRAGFVVMPGHIHAVVGLRDPVSLAQVMASLSRYTSRSINRILGRQGQFWEEGYYDRALRSRSEFDDMLTYMHMNPVEEGLVESPEEWIYSSASSEFSDLIDWEWLGSVF